MKFTENAIKVIKAHESCHLVAYRTRKGIWAIGYSHTNGVRMSSTLKDESEADKLLREDAGSMIKAIERLLNKGQFTFVPNQNQIDALVSFAQNQGIANLSRLIEGRNAKAMSNAFLNFNRINGIVDPELTARRTDERTLFIAYPGVDNVNIKEVTPRIIDKQEDEPPIVNEVEDGLDIDMMIQRTINADGTTVQDIVPFDRFNQ